MDPATIIMLIGAGITLVNTIIARQAAASAARDKAAAEAAHAEAKKIVDDIMKEPARGRLQ